MGIPSRATQFQNADTETTRRRRQQRNITVFIDWQLYLIFLHDFVLSAISLFTLRSFEVKDGGNGNKCIYFTSGPSIARISRL